MLDELVHAADVETQPGELCERWCPSLHRCPDGKAWVRKYRGDEVLAARLADAPSALDRSA